MTNLTRQFIRSKVADSAVIYKRGVHLVPNPAGGTSLGTYCPKAPASIRVQLAAKSVSYFCALMNDARL